MILVLGSVVIREGCIEEVLALFTLGRASSPRGTEATTPARP